MAGKNPVPKKKQVVVAAMTAAIGRPKRKHRGRKPKSSQIELAERRQIVIRMRLQGKTLREIGKELGIGYMTAKRDLDTIRSEVSEKVSQFDRDYALGKSISVYEQIEDEAWREYYGAASGGPSKAQFLNLVRAARNDQVKLLTEVGLINKAPVQVQHEFQAQAVLKNWTEDAKRIVALAIIRAQMEGADATKLLEGGNGHGKLIDIPAEPAVQPATEPVTEIKV